MLRKLMGGLVALMLVATLLLPAATVGAQDDDIELGPAPVLTEETVPDAESPPVEEVPPIVEPQPEAPMIEEPIVEQPVVEAPIAEERVAEEPAVDEPGTEPDVDDIDVGEEAEVEGEATEGAETPEDQAAADDVEAAGSTTISSMSLDCTGLLAFTIAETNGGTLTIWLYGDNADLGEEVIENPASGPVQVQFSVESESLPDTIGATVVDENYDVVGVTGISECASGGDEEENEEEQESGSATVISGATLACDGTLTFTIAEAGEETLTIAFTNLHAPSVGRDMGSISFPVTGAGTFQVSIGVDAWVDVFQADIYSPLAETIIEQAAAYGCISGEEQTLGGISNMTLTCAGVVSFSVGAVEGAVSINLYDGSTNPHTSIASEGLGYIIDGGGEARSIDFAIPAGVYDSLVVRAYAHNNWAALDIAYANDCLDEDEESDPDPEPVGATVTNLRLFCNGLVRFDLETESTATLDIALSTIAPTPEFERNAQVSGGSGSYQHQFGVPAAWYNDFAVSISLGGTELAGTSLYGCLDGGLNTQPGEEVLAFTRYGMVIFEQVTAPGDTVIDRYWETNPPALPEGFGGEGTLYFDLSTTSTYVGAIEICLGMSQPFIEESDGVRLLQFVGDSWVDVTTSLQTDQGRVCGMTTSLSTFAIARQIDDTEPETGNTPTGSGVVVAIEGGATITFDAVDSAGETTIAILDPSQAPPLPAVYANGPVILLDISSSASFTGPATICLPVVASFGSLEGARLLHYENGSWVDITVSVDPTTRIVCGVSSGFSPFAIVRLVDDQPGEPVNPGNPVQPGKPVHPGHGPWDQARAQSVAASDAGGAVPLTGLPNTGGGQPEQRGTEAVQLMLGALALVAAAGLRFSTTRTRGRHLR